MKLITEFLNELILECNSTHKFMIYDLFKYDSNNLVKYDSNNLVKYDSNNLVKYDSNDLVKYDSNDLVKYGSNNLNAFKIVVESFDQLLIILKYQDYIPWKSSNISISEKYLDYFLNRYKSILNWESIILNTKLSVDLIKKYIKYINLDYCTIKNQKLDLELICYCLYISLDNESTNDLNNYLFKKITNHNLKNNLKNYKREWISNYNTNTFNVVLSFIMLFQDDISRDFIQKIIFYSNITIKDFDNTEVIYCPKIFIEKYEWMFNSYKDYLDLFEYSLYVLNINDISFLIKYKHYLNFDNKLLYEDFNQDEYIEFYKTFKNEIINSNYGISYLLEYSNDYNIYKDIVYKLKLIDKIDFDTINTYYYQYLTPDIIESHLKYLYLPSLFRDNKYVKGKRFIKRNFKDLIKLKYFNYSLYNTIINVCPKLLNSILLNDENWKIISSVNLPKDIIIKHIDKIDLTRLNEISILNLDIKFIETYKDKLKWNSITLYFNFTFEQLFIFKDYIDWEYLDYTKYNFKDILNSFREYLSWYVISYNIDKVYNPIKFIEDNKDQIHFDIIEPYKHLSIDFILKNKDLINLNTLIDSNYKLPVEVFIYLFDVKKHNSEVIYNYVLKSKYIDFNPMIILLKYMDTNTIKLILENKIINMKNRLILIKYLKYLEY